MKKTKTTREREVERVSSIGWGTGANIVSGMTSSISKININFNQDSQMTSSGSNLIGLVPKEETKINKQVPKKFLQNTNSSSLLDTMANANNNSGASTTLNKGNQYFPNFR